jgi:hypothetical protein
MHPKSSIYVSFLLGVLNKNPGRRRKRVCGVFASSNNIEDF